MQTQSPSRDPWRVFIRQCLTAADEIKAKREARQEQAVATCEQANESKTPVGQTGVSNT